MAFKEARTVDPLACICHSFTHTVDSTLVLIAAHPQASVLTASVSRRWGALGSQGTSSSSVASICAQDAGKLQAVACVQELPRFLQRVLHVLTCIAHAAQVLPPATPQWTRGA